MQPRSRPGGNALRGMLLWELAIEMTGDGAAVRSGDRDIAVVTGSSPMSSVWISGLKF